MSKKYVGAIDQGTTSTRFMLFNHDGEVVGSHQIEHEQIYPKPGWVEHNPMEVIQKTRETIKHTLNALNIKPEEIASIGITNQRETSLIWNKDTGQPYYNAIVWQDTRTKDICDALIKDGGQDRFRAKTGLPIATYFSGTKIKWLLDNIPEIKKDAAEGKALFGNMDTWIIWWLTGGPDGGVHVTDVTNASRTMLMNLETLDWDEEMLKIFGIPRSILPQIRPSSDPEIYGYTKDQDAFGGEIPVCGDLGDQQAALFGQTCFEVGDAKNTYGTGCFVLLNTGNKPIQSKYGLVTTLGYKLGSSEAVYSLEGSIAITGALVQWLRDNLKMLEKSSDIEKYAREVEDNGGVYFVPAFSGLFAPYWRMDARGVIVGLTRYATKGHIMRAALEATAYQTRDVIDAMYNDSGIKLTSLKVDGGMVQNELLMEFQADILGTKVIRPKVAETTALGAAYASGLAVGFWENLEDLKKNWIQDKVIEPKMPEDKREYLYKQWKKAVERTFNWVD